MAISSDVIAQFVKVTNDDKKTKSETTVYGTIVEHSGSTYVRLDGSELLTPINTTSNVSDGERVAVLIKNHTATVMGNMSSPAARMEDIQDSTEVLKKIAEFEILITYRITTEDLQAVNAIFDRLKSKSANIADADIVNAEIESLQAKYADLEYVMADDVDILNADIENLKAIFGTFADISTEDLEAINADIDNLKSYNANFTYVSAEVIRANKAEINRLDAEKLGAEEASLKYANIDFTNIGKAAMEYFYATSGLIESVTVSDGTITGRLVGVTISGDILEGNTVVADKLVIKGSDGLYYKLNTDGITTAAEQTDYNSLNGQVIKAKSITAEKVSVSDLVAFDATIGGFNITPDSIYSEVKDSEGNTTRGIYMDRDGQFNFGDETNFVRYYRDEDGTYRLAISAESILYSLNGKQHSIADLGLIGEYVHIGTYEGEPCILLGESDSDFKLVITNTRILFMEGTDIPAFINNKSLHIKKAVIEEELQQGEFVWKVRQNGNMGLIWKGATN